MLNAYGIEDDNGANVNPLGDGSVQPNMATPSMAEGGAIPEDDATGDASPNTDVTDYTGAMKIVREALNYGRQQHGLPASRPQQAQDEEHSAIPDEEDNGSEESYAEGGTIADDIEAGNASQPDEEQYGRPQRLPIAENGEAPPISSGNLSAEELERSQAPSGDNSGMGPVGAIPDDDSGMGPVAGGQQPAAQPADMSGTQVGGDPNDAVQTMNPQQILRYLTRATAMPEDQAKQLEQSVASNAQHDKNATTMAATVKANEVGGSETASAYLQRNAKRYEAALSHARAALEGVPGRPPSLDAAVASATEAFVNLPDAADVRFVKRGNGIGAIVRDLNGGAKQQYNLSPQQFAKMLDIGGDGQWDRVLAAGGANGVLKQAGASPANSSISQASGTISPEAMKQFEGQARNVGGGGSAPGGYGQFGRDPATGKPFTAGSRPPTPSETQDMALMHREAGMADAIANGMNSDQIAKKFGPDPRRMAGEGGKVSFPGYRAYQRKYSGVDPVTGESVANRPVRVIGQGPEDKTYVNGIDQAPTEHEKKLELVRAKNEGRGGRSGKDYDAETKLAERKSELKMKENEARSSGITTRTEMNNAARDKREQAKIDLGLKRLESQMGNADLATRGRVMAEFVKAAGGFDRLSKDQQETARALVNGSSGAQQRPASPQGAAPPAQSGPPSPGMKQFNGKWYTREQYQQEFGR